MKFKRKKKKEKTLICKLKKKKRSQVWSPSSGQPCVQAGGFPVFLCAMKQLFCQMLL